VETERGKGETDFNEETVRLIDFRVLEEMLSLLSLLFSNGMKKREPGGNDSVEKGKNNGQGFFWLPQCCPTSKTLAFLNSLMCESCRTRVNV